MIWKLFIFLIAHLYFIFTVGCHSYSVTVKKLMRYDLGDRYDISANPTHYLKHKIRMVITYAVVTIMPSSLNAHRWHICNVTRVRKLHQSRARFFAKCEWIRTIRSMAITLTIFRRSILLASNVRSLRGSPHLDSPAVGEAGSTCRTNRLARRARW